MPAPSAAEEEALEDTDDSDEGFVPVPRHASVPRRKRSLPRQLAMAAKEAGPAKKRGRPAPKPTGAAAPPAQPAGDADQQHMQATESSRADSDRAHNGQQSSPAAGDGQQRLSGSHVAASPPAAAPAVLSEGKTGKRTAAGPEGTLRNAGSAGSAGGCPRGSAGPAASSLHKTAPAAASVPGQRKLFQLAVGSKLQKEAAASLAAEGSGAQPDPTPSKPTQRPAGPSAADAAVSRAVLAKLLRGDTEKLQQAVAVAGQHPHASTEPAGNSNSADATHTQQPVSPPARAEGSLPAWCQREEAYIAGASQELPPPRPSSPRASTPTSSRMPIASPFQQQQTQHAVPSRQPSDPRLSASAAHPSVVPWSHGRGWQQQRQAGPGHAGVPYTAASAAPGAPIMKQEPDASLRNHSLPAPAQPGKVRYPQHQPAAQLGHSTMKAPSWATQQQWPAGQASGLATPGHGNPPAAQQPQQHPVASIHVQGAVVATETRVPAAAFAPLTAAAVVAVKQAKPPDALLSRRWVSLSVFTHCTWGNTGCYKWHLQEGVSVQAQRARRHARRNASTSS